MNCSAQIYNENDAAKFLYSYNNKPLSEIMDTEIRSRVESKFVEECGRLTLNEILAKKDVIMNAVRKDVMDYFDQKGITITVLGLKDGIEYDDKAIQQSINEKFSSEMKLTTQENENKRIISEAQAKAEALLLEAKAQAEANKKLAESLDADILQKLWIEKWSGTLPQYTIGKDGNVMIGLPNGG
jgi:regulator of protease activity HflC (stomatin/prohibitin superfamily)